jgi:hypothetical protein
VTRLVVRIDRLTVEGGEAGAIRPAALAEQVRSALAARLSEQGPASRGPRADHTSGSAARVGVQAAAGEVRVAEAIADAVQGAVTKGR